MKFEDVGGNDTTLKVSLSAEFYSGGLTADRLFKYSLPLLFLVGTGCGKEPGEGRRANLTCTFRMLRGKGSIVPSAFLPRGLWCAEDACFVSDAAVAEVAVMVNVSLVSALFHLPRVMSARLRGRWYDSWGRGGVESFRPESH